MIDITRIKFKTENLEIRSFKQEDIDDFYEYAKVEGVGELAGWSHHKNIKEKNVFAVVLAENKKVIGSIDIHNYKESYAIGFVLSKDYWGKGFMCEAAIKVIDYYFNILKLDNLYYSYSKKNYQSKRVNEKLGFVLLKEENNNIITLKKRNKN